MTKHSALRPTRLALALAFFLVTAPAAFSQVVVYRFEFKQEGIALNYGFYDEGWVVADATGGPAQWVLTFRDGAHRRYISVTDFGSLFYANNRKKVVGVISAAAASGTPQTTFLAAGDVNTTVKGGNVSVKVPEQLEGYAQSADDESDLPFDSSEGNVGYVGISKMTGSLQNRRTADANTRNMTVTEAFDDLVAYIKRRGFEEFVITAPAAAAATTTGGTGTGTGGGTP